MQYVPGKPLDTRYLPLVLDVLDQGVFTVDENTRITSFNKAAEQITGHVCADVIGLRCAEVFRTNLCDQVCPLRLSIAVRRPMRNHEVTIRSRDGRHVPISVSTAPLVTRSGRLLGGIEVFRDLSELTALRRRVETEGLVTPIVGRSEAMRRILALLPPVASSDATVLVTGASGTGKELLVKTIHSLGQRRTRPFIALNCAAVPETLIESELFGYKRGAFTDARRDKPGRIGAAEGGTLFLDEIGDLPITTQVKVLRFLQDHVYEPLGSNRSARADVRVVAATHRDLPTLVRAGKFREDLYFRLNVVQIDIPPLRERPEDIPLLTAHYVRQFRESTGKPIDGLSDRAMSLLMAYPFPGNVRELINLVERAFVFCRGDRIRAEHLPPAVLHGSPSATEAPAKAIATIEKQAILDALERHGGNRTRAAIELGIHRVTLVRKLARLRSPLTSPDPMDGGKPPG
jgi:sigma-54 dependent transcriptional regulator, acetoin dehydrogenase operon transcriptional activator AcoR